MWAALAAEIREQVAADAASLARRGCQPGLGTILVGDDPASETYVNIKMRECAAVGIASVHEHLPADTDLGDLARRHVGGERLERHRRDLVRVLRCWHRSRLSREPAPFRLEAEATIGELDGGDERARGGQHGQESVASAARRTTSSRTRPRLE